LLSLETEVMVKEQQRMTESNPLKDTGSQNRKQWLYPRSWEVDSLIGKTQKSEQESSDTLVVK
jgi:hypothetical protein